MAAIGWDKGHLYHTSVLAPQIDQSSNYETQEKLHEFIQNFRIDNSFLYRDQLRQNLMAKQYFLEVDLKHLSAFNEDLAQMLNDRPAEILPLFEAAVKESARRILYANPAPKTEQEIREQRVPDFQVTLRSQANKIPIRQLDASYMSKLVRLPGIVIAASTLSSKASYIHAMCRTCRTTKMIAVPAGFGGVSLPRICDSTQHDGKKSKCGLDPFFIVHEKSQFVDQQVMKLQEIPEEVPVGELPRHVQLNADRYLTNKVVPGERVVVVGIFSISQNKPAKSSGGVGLRAPYIRVVGLETDSYSNARGRRIFTPEEEEEYINMSRMPNIYETFARSIAPSIFGSLDIKKAIACLLFGGSKKHLPDGMRLRGDVNVLLLGDPGTAKSQLLKFVEKVAPISVYTSGKGSSAAGLTASVIRDAGSGEFYLEAGAMVLADGGVVCIDEFDKMREEDRVAIHEAMEQQTISIAKAGITTILNSRASVLAAANPRFGRYDDMKAPGENIDFQTTILSRFDMIFIVKDEHDEQRDLRIARHVVSIHKNEITEEIEGDISVEKMRGYISYCRDKCAPRLSKEAAEKLSNHFVYIRKEIHKKSDEEKRRTAIPITIRQLEAIVRISEALAKMSLSPVATEHHVDEAIRLFKHSTMDAVQTGGIEGMTRSELMQEVQQIQSSICKRLAVGSRVPLNTIKAEFRSKGYTETAINRAIQLLVRQETLQQIYQGHMLLRSGL
ncbi:uncharacterized protein VTP21DRAFT_11407 [Calcarisporiella thermophila]|uniref:uncharacterized protein n=1 Tax=Calcarisporiella thermophila TaxID=911321 RepID=UPI0037445966